MLHLQGVLRRRVRGPLVAQAARGLLLRLLGRGLRRLQGLLRRLRVLRQLLQLLRRRLRVRLLTGAQFLISGGEIRDRSIAEPVVPHFFRILS
ncbi:hypothetical protein SGPA1_20057 [Streptomyces misionensis JCM 4497]